MEQQQRKQLESAIARARSLLEEDYAELLEGRFGIHSSGQVEKETELALPHGAQEARTELVAVFEHLQDEGLSPEQAVRRLLREAVFTSLNRLVAIRVAEAIGLLPESLLRGRDSRGYREFLEIFPLLAKNPDGGYWTYLRACADELAHDAPVLFDPRNPLLALEPSPKALDELLQVLADPALEPVWSDPEAFGWTYQYFISAEERRAAREGQAPRNSHELAVRNQWFTPRYVVNFLVQNTLGRRLLEANPGSALRDELPLLVDPPWERGRPLDLEEVRVLDPAVGSGHFLLGCYDLLERAWQERGVSPEEAAPRILPCLWGIDIDPRCAQVAAAALMLRARRGAKDADLPRPNIFTARPLPADPEAWRGALVNLDEDLKRLVDRIRHVLARAPVLGSLLKVEEALRYVIQAYAQESASGPLFTKVARDEFARAEAQILQAIRQAAADASSTAAERLLAAEATDAIGFIEAMRQRYDTVLMNPPFGEPIPDTKNYLKAAYPWIPWKDYNVLAAFVGRGVELLREAGYVGAITSRAGLFLTTFEEWRRQVLLPHRFVTLADLGYGVMEGAMVEAAAYVVGADPRRPGERATFLRLLKDTDRAAAIVEACREAREGKTGGRVFRVAPEELEEIPGAPLAYWVAPSIRRLFREVPPLEGNGAEVRQGLATADDFRFVRAFWEVAPGRIARSRQETFEGKRWVPFAKGGEYSPYYADIHLVVDWEKDGRRLREDPKAVVRNAQYYFRPGLTWTLRTNSGFSPRILPAGAIFSHGGNGMFSLRGERFHLGWLLLSLNSRLGRQLVESLTVAAEETMSGSPARNYTVGPIQLLPDLASSLAGSSAAETVGELPNRIASIVRGFVERDETARVFTCPAVLRRAGTSLEDRVREALGADEGSVVRGIDLAYQSERVLHQALELDQEAERYLDEEYGPHPGSYPAEPLAADEEKEFARLYRMPIDRVIDEIVATQGGSRTIATKSYFLDRRLEVLAHRFRRHPQVLAETRRRLGLLPPEEPRRSAEELVSYLVGCTLGRWDVRIGRDPSLAPPALDPFEPVPLCSPGMLVGPDGLSARQAPKGYPLKLPPERILLDEPGHRWDIVRSVREAAEVLFDDADGVLEECERILGRDLRTYFRRDFFKSHLSRYSKSRRKAPIYWYLSVPSRNWGVWVYAPALTRETLFAVVRESRRKEGQLVQEQKRLEQEAAGASGRERQRLMKRLDETESLLREVRTFFKEAERVTNLGWEPDLDDGLILCAAPLADLMPSWRASGKPRGKNPADPGHTRQLIKEGAFPWASVSNWKDRL